MKKVRKDVRGRVLHRGESYIKKKSLFCFYYTDLWGKRKFLYAKDLAELRKKEEELERNRLDRLETYPVANPDLNYVYDRYFANKQGLRSSTKGNYTYTYDHYVRNGFGKKKISEIRYSDVLTFYNGLLKTGLQIGMVASIHRLIHPALDLAVRDNVLKSNPSNGVMTEVKKHAAPPKPRHALTLETQRIFLKELDNPEYEGYKNFFVVMFGTGVRVGELIGLRWCDVDFDKSVININHAISYYRRVESNGRAEFRVSLPKTMAGIRTIPMLDKVKEALLKEKQDQDKSGHYPIVEIDGMSGFIFCNKYRMLHNHNSLDRFIRKVVDHYNLKEIKEAEEANREPVILPRFSCHITRHSFCTRLCENDVNIKVVQSTMGHKRIQTTLDVYTDVTESKKMEVFELLNNNIIF
jgi:integrase